MVGDPGAAGQVEVLQVSAGFAKGTQSNIGDELVVWKTIEKQEQEVVYM